MSEPKQPPQTPPGPEPGPDREAERKFFEWVPEVPRAEAPDTSEKEPHDPEAELRKAQLGAGARFLVMCVVTAVAVWAMSASWTNFRYFLQSGTAPVDLGDLRAPEHAHQPLDQPSNTFARLSGAIVTLEAEARSGGYLYFFSPVGKVIVQTEQKLSPKQEGAVVEIPEHLVDLVLGRHIFPDDLVVNFKGEGRLFKATELPGYMTSLLDYYLPRLVTPKSELYVFLDGDTPGAYQKYAFLWAIGVLGFGLSLWLFVRSLRRLRAGLKGHAAG
jgi:hypothetical protein